MYSLQHKNKKFIPIQLGDMPTVNTSCHDNNRTEMVLILPIDTEKGNGIREGTGEK